MEKAISAKNIQYTYGVGKGRTEALKGIDLSVNPGEIFGFLGPNGAGKTTTIKLLLGILTPEKGDLTLFGRPPVRADSRQNIGYMPEIADYYRYLTPSELLAMYGNIFGIRKSVLRVRINKLLEEVDLSENAGRAMKTFSKGMMQKVSFAQALINDPDLLILDEPASGLDPVARKKMREVIRGLKEKGKTIFFSSHELSEVELVCDRIGILNKGHLLAAVSVNDLIVEKEEGQSLENYFLKMIGEKP